MFKYNSAPIHWACGNCALKHSVAARPNRNSRISQESHAGFWRGGGGNAGRKGNPSAAWNPLRLPRAPEGSTESRIRLHVTIQRDRETELKTCPLV